MYAINQSSWELYKLKQLPKKTDREENMKLSFLCKILGIGGNVITKE